MTQRGTSSASLCPYLRPPPCPLLSPPFLDNFSGCIISSSSLGQGPWLSGGSPCPGLNLGTVLFPKTPSTSPAFPTSPNTHIPSRCLEAQGLAQGLAQGSCAGEDVVGEERGRDSKCLAAPLGKTGPPPPSVWASLPRTHDVPGAQSSAQSRTSPPPPHCSASKLSAGHVGPILHRSWLVPTGSFYSSFHLPLHPLQDQTAWTLGASLWTNSWWRPENGAGIRPWP